MRSSILRRRASLGTAVAALGVSLTALSAHPAAAQTVVYNNLTTATGTSAFTGNYFRNAAGTTATTSTPMVADDITPIAGFAGSSVSSFTFTTVNVNAAATTFVPTISFYTQDPVSGVATTLLGAFNFSAPVTQNAGTITTRTATIAPGAFLLPSGTFWAGVSFSGASVAELNNLGQGIYAAPIVGSSQDLFFDGTGSAPLMPTSNPAGTLSYFGGSPAANFGWSFSVAAPTPAPEASTTVSLGLMLALGMGGLVIASKRKKASVQA